jgi:hypothetical protein
MKELFIGPRLYRGSDQNERIAGHGGFPKGVAVFFGTVIRDTSVPPVLGAIYAESIRHGRDGRVTTVPKKTATPVSNITTRI